MKYKTDGQNAVFCGKIKIAQSYIGDDGPEVRVLQGTPRIQVLEKIQQDCPIFLLNNQWTPDKYPKVF